MENSLDRQIFTDEALHKFSKVSFSAKIHQLWAKLTHRCFCLLNLDDETKRVPLASSHYAGVQNVDINRIRGTQGKANEFDAEFNPTQKRSRNRWTNIAVEKMRGHELPPVELIQIGDIYYVRDGHHRISVSRSMGQFFIDAEITEMQLQPNGNVV
jgi:hypothetical protein